MSPAGLRHFSDLIEIADLVTQVPDCHCSHDTFMSYYIHINLHCMCGTECLV